jgi:hypothetical protein
LEIELTNLLVMFLFAAAALLLAGQLLYVVITQFHTGSEANSYATMFAAYAASQIWTGVHVAQFACMAIMLGGLLALFFALDVPPQRPGGQLDSVPHRQGRRSRCAASSWPSALLLNRPRTRG